MPAHPQVTFETDFFKMDIVEEQGINPGRYGKELAHWLADRLNERGVPVRDVVAEDFGWAVVVGRKPFRLWLGCGNTDGSTTEWSIFPVAERTVLQRLFRRANSAPAIEELRTHLSELVATIPRVSNVTWE